jgi:hypothetical protein
MILLAGLPGAEQMPAARILFAQQHVRGMVVGEAQGFSAGNAIVALATADVEKGSDFDPSRRIVGNHRQRSATICSWHRWLQMHFWPFAKSPKISSPQFTQRPTRMTSFSRLTWRYLYGPGPNWMAVASTISPSAVTVHQCSFPLHQPLTAVSSGNSLASFCDISWQSPITTSASVRSDWFMIRARASAIRRAMASACLAFMPRLYIKVRSSQYAIY